jgi:hypothetical protein
MTSLNWYLQNQFDKVKRKALLGPNAIASAGDGSLGFSASNLNHEDRSAHLRTNIGGVTIGQVAEGMDANRVCPVVEWKGIFGRLAFLPGAENAHYAQSHNSIQSAMAATTNFNENATASTSLRSGKHLREF